jgi:hypothetical protein
MPVQVTEAVGASVPVGHVIATDVPGETAWSTIVGVPTVTLPVFVTITEYVIVWPAVVTDVGDALLLTEIAGAGVAVTVTIEPGEVVVVPVGSLPVAVPVSVIEPLSMSACVTV